MADIRIHRWADILINYSLAVQPGQHVILSGDYDAMPLLEACYEAIIQKGATAEVFLTSKILPEILFQFGSDEQIKRPPLALTYAAQHCDAFLTIGAESNSKSLANVDPKKQVLASQARKPILEAILNRAAKSEMRWAYTCFPTAAAAQEAEMGTREFEEFIFSLGYLNCENPIEEWKRIAKEQDKIIAYLSNKKELHFTNPAGTDLKVNVDGMRWVNCCGRINFPDGEVYTGPNLNHPSGGVNGVAKFSFPTLYKNVEVRDISLKFENGAVTEAKASKGEDFLNEMIHQDPGAKFVGEIAIGTNYMMQRITKNILFDEKFGGTFHLALGKGYPQTGNTNESALHWDMIFDLRNGGKISADGELFYENGHFFDRMINKST